MAYSEWAGLDSRYLIAGALVLLVATALVDAAGATNLANTLAEFVFFLLAGGVVLLLVDHVRERPAHREGDRWGSGLRTWESHPADPPKEGQGPPEHPFDGSEE